VKLLPAAVLAAAALVLGFFLGRTTANISPQISPDSISSDSTRDLEQSATHAESLQTAQTIHSQEVTVQQDEPDPLDFPTLMAHFANIAAASPEQWDQFNARLEVSDLPELARSIIDNYPAAGTEESMFLVFDKIARQAPDQAWQLMLSIKNPQLREQAGYTVTGAIADSDFAKVIGLVNALPSSAFKTQMRQGALAVLASRDPAKAFALEVQYAADKPDFAPHAMIHTWVRRDTDAAIAAISQLSGSAATTANTALLQSLAAIDPAKAWNHAQTLPRRTDDIWQDPRYSTLSAWGGVDPMAAMQAALSVDDAEVRSLSVGEIARNWAGSDFPAALSFVTSLTDPGTRAKALAGMASSDGARKPELFSALLEFGPVGDHSQAHYLLKQWAAEDPVAAAAAIQQLPAGRAFEQAAGEFARGWLAANNSQPSEVIKWAESLPSGAARAAAARAVFEELGRKDASLAAGFIAAMNPVLQNDASEGLANSWGDAEPSRAAAWAASLSAEVKESILPGIISQWARRTPEQAAEFARLHDNTGHLVSAVAQEWMPYSPEKAGYWVDNLPAGDARDNGLSTVGRIVLNEDPAAAVLWLSRMSSAERREEELLSVCSQWLESDPAAAKAWIFRSSLTETSKASLLR
jgi:hypothetical protein